MISRPKNLEKYICIRKFQARNHSEISLDVGQCVEVVNKDATGWWLVYAYDSQGYAPGSSFAPMDDTQSGGSEEYGSSLYMTTKAYKAQRADELSLQANQYVLVLTKSYDGWWLVQRLKRPILRGKFPAVYLKNFTANHRTENNANAHDRSLQERQRGFFIPRFRDLTEILKNKLPRRRNQQQHHQQQQQQRRRRSSASTAGDHSKRTTPETTIIDESTVEIFQAKEDYFDFVGDSASFVEGDLFEVVHKDPTGWWYAKHQGSWKWVSSAYLVSYNAGRSDAVNVSGRRSPPEPSDPRCPVIDRALTATTTENPGQQESVHATRPVTAVQWLGRDITTAKTMPRPRSIASNGRRRVDYMSSDCERITGMLDDVTSDLLQEMSERFKYRRFTLTDSAAATKHGEHHGTQHQTDIGALTEDKTESSTSHRCHPFSLSLLADTNKDEHNTSSLSSLSFGSKPSDEQHLTTDASISSITPDASVSGASVNNLIYGCI